MAALLLQLEILPSWRRFLDVDDDDDDDDMGGSPGELSEELVTQEKRKKGWRLNCDVGEATEGLENEL